MELPRTTLLVNTQKKQLALKPRTWMRYPKALLSLATTSDFIDQGYNVIIGTSFGYMDDMLSLADEYPDVVFEHVSGYKMNETNFGNTFGRMYGPRYLSGMVAGSATSSKSSVT